MIDEEKTNNNTKESGVVDKSKNLMLDHCRLEMEASILEMNALCFVLGRDDGTPKIGGSISTF
jgi:hypothetical protein